MTAGEHTATADTGAGRPPIHLTFAPIQLAAPRSPSAPAQEMRPASPPTTRGFRRTGRQYSGSRRTATQADSHASANPTSTINRQPTSGSAASACAQAISRPDTSTLTQGTDKSGSAPTTAWKWANANGGSCSTPITRQIIDGLTHSHTPRMVADQLGMPLEFVDLVIERERAAGHLKVYDLRSCNSTTGEGCDPDPESLVCSGCPILPREIRKRQSFLGRLRANIRR